MKILAISSCSEKQEKETLPAWELYIGDEHQKIKTGLEKVWEDRQNNGISVDWRLVSTGHGLIHKECVLEPYDVSTDKSQILKSEKLHKDIEELIKDYDLVFFLLGKPFYMGQRLDKCPFEVSDEVTQIFLIYTKTKGYRHLIPENLPNCNVVELNSNDFKSGYTAKGYVFEKLCEAACRDGFEVFEKVKDDPQLILDIVQ